MKIQLTQALPVADEHGMTEGRILDVIRENKHAGRNVVHWYVMGDASEEVGIYGREATVVTESLDPPGDTEHTKGL